MGIECPQTFVVTDPRNIPFKGFRFPIVFKSVVDQGTVQYADSEHELERIVARFWKSENDIVGRKLFPIIQEYIAGDGYGFFGLMMNGELKSYFMHRRLHEVPPTGGPSAMAESCKDNELFSLGKRLLEKSGWNGVAMAEFKKSSSDGKFYLIEVNPKFWGSLDLAINAGVDFPLYLFRELIGEKYVQQTPYRIAVTYRWISMDLAYSIQSRKIFEFIKGFFRKDMKSDFDKKDMSPFFVLFLRSVFIFFEKKFSASRHLL